MSSSSLENAKRALQSRLFIIDSYQVFYAFTSKDTHSVVGSLFPYRFVVTPLLYDSYPMGRTSASTSLIPQLVQAVIPPQHVLRAFFYTNRRKGVKMIFK